MIKKYLFDFVIFPVLRVVDFVIPKKKSYWGFSVHHIKSDQFIENARAVFEVIKSDERLKKVIFTRTETNDFNINDAKNFEIVKLKSLKGIILFLQCKVLFVTHSISMDYSFRWEKGKFSVFKINMRNRLVVNLWHGIPFKKLYALWNPLVRQRLDRVKYRQIEKKQYAGLISSSTIDSYAMATMFYPIMYDQIWLTGLPRNDFLMKKLEKLPFYLQGQIKIIQQLKKGKKLITYAPTYRQTAAVSDAVYYQFSPDEISMLKDLLNKHNAIFGFRMHYFRNNKALFNMEDYIDNELIFDLGHNKISEIAAVIRESDVVISDYSSVFIEAIYLGKAVLGFAYDLEHYRTQQDGLLYDLDMVFPGPFVKTFSELLIKMNEELTAPSQVSSEKYRFSQKLFYEYLDSGNSERVVGLVRKQLRCS